MSNRTTTVTTGDITVNSQATDAKGIARDIGQSMNFLFPAQFNAGLS